MSQPPPSVPPPASRSPDDEGPRRHEMRLLELEPPSGGLKRLLGGRGPMRLVLSPSELVIEHAQFLQTPLRVAPGGVSVGAVDPGPAQVARDGRAGRFPILHCMPTGKVVPREEGIEGWLWTSTGGTTMASLTGDDAPNVALLLNPPLSARAAEASFQPSTLADLAKRSPLGQPAVYGLLLRVVHVEQARDALNWLGLLGSITDRDVPPTQRRHLPGDRPANPEATGAERVQPASRSVPPPGRGG